MKPFHVELDLYEDISDGEDVLKEHITDVVESNESEFNELMARTCRKYDMRAELLDDTLQVHDVSVSDSGGVVSVVYYWDAYYGCKDMNCGDGVDDEWEFKLEGKKIIFDLELPEIERYDEI